MFFSGHSTLLLAFLNELEDVKLKIKWVGLIIRLEDESETVLDLATDLFLDFLCSPAITSSYTLQDIVYILKLSDLSTLLDCLSFKITILHIYISLLNLVCNISASAILKFQMFLDKVSAFIFSPTSHGVIGETVYSRLLVSPANALVINPPFKQQILSISKIPMHFQHSQMEQSMTESLLEKNIQRDKLSVRHALPSALETGRSEILPQQQFDNKGFLNSLVHSVLQLKPEHSSTFCSFLLSSLSPQYAYQGSWSEYEQILPKRSPYPIDQFTEHIFRQNPIFFSLLLTLAKCTNFQFL